ncbi:regulatory protein RecX [Effusibacillus pohliae]|uniref:regulatory protein RecX n=1 Tax=Effusibacillus pohliae TaxID=232270 RepID=UPI000366ED03|nr:RecX family transcriptional regulator [Effusibacillus pohliae]
MRPERIITAIERQKAHPDRVSLFVNGEFALGMRRELVYRLQLRVGLPVTEADLAEWEREETRLHACDLAAKYLAQRSRSSQQVLAYLKRKEIPPEIAEAAVRYLESLGYLDDERFAADFVYNRIRSKPRGRRMICWELQQTGVSGDTIERALAAYEDETEAARRLIERKKFAKTGGDPANEREIAQKIARYLAGKGFSNDTIRSILRELRKK